MKVRDVKENLKKAFHGWVAVGIVLLLAAIVLLATVAPWGTTLGYIAFAGGVVGMFCFALAWVKWDERRKLEKETAAPVVPAPAPVPDAAALTPVAPAAPTPAPVAPVAPARKTRAALKAERDAADDQLVEAELAFRDAEKRDDEAKNALAEYEAILAAAKARRAAKP